MYINLHFELVIHVLGLDELVLEFEITNRFVSWTLQVCLVFLQILHSICLFK